MFLNVPLTAQFVSFLLLRKSAEPGKIFAEKTRDEESSADFQKIRCPHCRWRPRAADRWFCGDCAHPEFFFGGCGADWNTFATGGRCPGCRHLWKWTLCLRCNEWARHEDWYASESE